MELGMHLSNKYSALIKQESLKTKFISFISVRNLFKDNRLKIVSDVNDC